jgi:hypothetical protein
LTPAAAEEKKTLSIFSAGEATKAAGGEIFLFSSEGFLSLLLLAVVGHAHFVSVLRAPEGFVQRYTMPRKHLWQARKLSFSATISFAGGNT